VPDAVVLPVGGAHGVPDRGEVQGKVTNTLEKADQICQALASEGRWSGLWKRLVQLRPLPLRSSFPRRTPPPSRPSSPPSGLHFSLHDSPQASPHDARPSRRPWSRRPRPRGTPARCLQGPRASFPPCGRQRWVGQSRHPVTDAGQCPRTVKDSLPVIGERCD
jgi:hypothetical protein